MMNQPLFNVQQTESTDSLDPKKLAKRLASVVEGLDPTDAEIFTKANPESIESWQSAFRLFRGYYSQLDKPVLGTTELIAGHLLFEGGSEAFSHLFSEHIELLGSETLDKIELALIGFQDSFQAAECKVRPIYSLIEKDFKHYSEVADFFDFLPYQTGGTNGRKEGQIYDVCPVCSKGELEVNRDSGWASCSDGCNVVPELLKLAQKNGFIEKHITEFNKSANQLTPRGNVTKAKGEFIQVAEEDIPLGLTLVSAPMKSGKTRGYIQQAIEATKGHVAILVPRNTLAFDAANRLGGQHISEVDHELPMPKVVTACLESIGKLRALDIELLVVDEFSQAVSQIAGGGTVKTILPVIQLLEAIQLVSKKGRVLLLEDGISNLEAELLEACGLTIQNTFVFEKEYPIKRDAVFVPDLKAFELAIQESIRAGENIMVFSDGGGKDKASSLLQTLELLLVDKLGLDKSEVLLVNAQSSRTCPRVKQLIADPDYACNQMGIRVLLASPTLQMGISFNDPEKHFSKVFCHFVHIEPRIAIQMSERLRTDVPRFFWVKKSHSPQDSKERGLDWRLIKKLALESNSYTLSATGVNRNMPDSLYGHRLALSQPVLDYKYKMKARANYANKSRLEAFQELYKVRGYSIIDPEDSQLDSQEWLAEAKLLSRAQALETFTNGYLKLTLDQAYLVLQANRNAKAKPEDTQAILEFASEYGPGTTYLVAKRVQLESEYMGLNWLNPEVANFYYFQGGLNKVKFALMVSQLDTYKWIVGQELIDYKGNDPLNWLPTSNRYDFPRLEFYANQMFILKRLINQGLIRKSDPLLAKLKESVLSGEYKAYLPNARRDSSMATASNLLRAFGLALKKDGRKPAYRVVKPVNYKLALEQTKVKFQVRLAKSQANSDN